MNISYKYFLSTISKTQRNTKLDRLFALQIGYKISDHFGPCHCAVGAISSPMAHENETDGPKWPLKILMAQIYTQTTAKTKLIQYD